MTGSKLGLLCRVGLNLGLASWVWFGFAGLRFVLVLGHMEVVHALPAQPDTGLSTKYTNVPWYGLCDLDSCCILTGLSAFLFSSLCSCTVLRFTAEPYPSSRSLVQAMCLSASLTLIIRIPLFGSMSQSPVLVGSHKNVPDPKARLGSHGNWSNRAGL